MMTMAVALAAECPRYVCRNLTEGTCLQPNLTTSHTEYDLQACSGEQVCDIFNLTLGATCRANYSHPLRYAGEFCRASSECYSGNCTSSFCTGLERGKACTGDANCNVGLYCGDGICTDTRKLGESCSATQKCASYLVCNVNKCIYALSLDNGQSASLPSACKSFHVDGDTGLCAPGPKLVRSAGDPAEGPAVCPYTNTCKYKAGEKEIKTACECGTTAEGKLYCPAGAGDFSLAPVAEYVRSLPEKHGGKDPCHVARGPFCLYKNIKYLGKVYNEAYVMYENLTRGVQYADNSDCVKRVMHKDYWYAHDRIYKVVDESPYMLVAITIIVVLISTILMAALYFRKWKKDAEAEDRK